MRKIHELGMKQTKCGLRITDRRLDEGRIRQVGDKDINCERCLSKAKTNGN